MKILITGSGGFIGTYIKKSLEKRHVLYTPLRDDFDLTNNEKVTKFFQKHSKNKPFDLVIHCAYHISPIKDIIDLNRNLIINFNLLENKRYYKNFINMGSGAEFDKSLPIHDDVNNLDDSYPLDSYGMGKNLIAKLIKPFPNFYNLRVFGCFGLSENSTRFIYKNLNHYINSEPLEIYQDRYFDFFNLKDLVKVIEYYIKGIEENYPLEKEIDLVYPNKIKLTDVANIINNLSEKKVKIKINNPELGNSYTGSKLGVPYDIEFDGLVKGIKQMYNSLNL